jgi:hypothetical protein
MRFVRAGLVVMVILVSACSAPPQKEIDLAQGALDAARAAGAEQYASQQYGAASDALRQAHDAVAQRDYRLALTRAMDAYDRAQDAAKGAADGKARARSEAELAIVAATAALNQYQTRIKDAESKRVARRDLDAAHRTASTTAATLQKARAHLNAGDYIAARDTVRDIPARLTAQTRALEVPAPRRPVRSPRQER